jgi:hypothetical protein
VNTNRDLVRNLTVTAAAIAVVLPSVWLATSFGKLALFGVVGVAGLIVATYVGLRHPLWYFWGLALIMGGLPYARIPGVGLPIWYLLAFGAIVAAFMHPRFARSTHPIEVAMWAMFITAAVSLLVTYQSLADISIFVRWSLATFFMFALSRLAPEHAVRFGKIYVVAAAVNGLYGIYVLAFDPNYTTLSYLRAFGYVPEALITRVATVGENQSTSIRLGGTWVEPNGAGLYLALAVALAMLLFAGWRRTMLVAVLSVALLLTLSRSATFTVIVGIVIVLIFHPMRARARMSLISVMTVAGLAALAVEPIRRRIFSSFGSGDVGSSARVDALRIFPDRMSGHWGFGWGWARREFIDPAYSYVFNLPSNAPLIVLYRSGTIAFIAFAALALIGCVYAYRAVRSNSSPYAIYGGIFIGLVLVQMQLDHPLAGTPTGALTYSIFLGFLVYVDRERRAALRQEKALPRAVPASTGKFVAASR